MPVSGRSESGRSRVSLGDIFAIRTRIGTSIDEEGRREISRHRGGVFFELAGHVLDQVVWLLGRPQKVTAFLRNDSGVVPEFPRTTPWGSLSSSGQWP